MKRLLYIIVALLSYQSFALAQHHCRSVESCRELSPCNELPRPVTSVYRIEIGHTNTYSSYLSPLHYTGTSLGLSGEWTKAFQKYPDNLVMEFDGGVNFRRMLNPAKTASMIGFDGFFNWGMSWRKRLPHNFQITAGGLLDINGGVLYLPRNGNNPANALVYAGIDLAVSGSWHTTIGKLPILIEDKIKLPSLGAFFSPEYGETYYEIYLGNHKNLAHCGWWGNRFCIDNLLSVKLDFGRTAMELGYRYNLRTEWANNLSTRIHTHSFVIGVIPQGLGLKKKKAANYSIY